jgi:hypothetical protein
MRVAETNGCEPLSCYTGRLPCDTGPTLLMIAATSALSTLKIRVPLALPVLHNDCHLLTLHWRSQWHTTLVLRQTWRLKS